ncbi:MAG: transcription antitermination factor NusB [Bacteroidota bacterium]
MQALYGYDLAVDSLKEIIANELSSEFEFDPALHDSLDKKQYEKKQRFVKRTFLERLEGQLPDDNIDTDIAEGVEKHQEQFGEQLAKERKMARTRMEQEIRNIYRNYLKFLLIPGEVALIEKQEKERREKSHTKRRMDYFYHFINNPVVDALSRYPLLADKVRDLKITWDQDRDEMRSWYKDVWAKNETVLDYQTKKSPSEEDHFRAVKHLMKQLVFKEEVVDEYMSGADLHWSENKAILKSMVTKTIQSYDPQIEEMFEMKTLSLNEEDDFRYFRVLFDETVDRDLDFQEIIANKSRNWDMSRVAKLDKIILKMALTEMIMCPSIPVKVTINEFIEISKLYSTPKSKQFVNGILDVLANELTSDGTIKKSGRGLIDNK